MRIQMMKLVRARGAGVTVERWRPTWRFLKAGEEEERREETGWRKEEIGEMI